MDDVARTRSDAHTNRLLRRQKLLSLIYEWSWIARLLFFVIGYTWMLILPMKGVTQSTWVDENALQPNSVNTHWEWRDVFQADRYLETMEEMRDRNVSKQEYFIYIKQELEKAGLLTGTQSYTFKTNSLPFEGINVYATLNAPRTSGYETIILCASWRSLSYRDDSATERNLNLRGIAFLMSLANYLKGMSLWAKEIVFVVSDGHLDGMQAFLATYHGTFVPNLDAESLHDLSGGVVWTALCLDYPGHSFSELGIFYEGINGRLPNQDLINSVQTISRWTGNVPVSLYGQPQSLIRTNMGPDLFRKLLNLQSVQNYRKRAKTVLKHLGYQALGRPSGVHGLFQPYRIDAITLYAVPASGPHGFYALGKIFESSLRTVNNLLERLHASFFFYLLVEPSEFIVIGKYLTSAVLVGIGLELNGLHWWVASGWAPEVPISRSLKEGGQRWIRRRRPLLLVLGIITLTHAVGFVGFLILTSRRIVGALEVFTSQILFTMTSLSLLVPLVVTWVAQSKKLPNTASPSSLLFSISLCMAGTTICITSVLNFSLAATLAILLGPSLPFTYSPHRQSTGVYACKLAFLTLVSPFGILVMVWMRIGKAELARTIVQCVWEWEALGGFLVVILERNQ